MPRKADVVPFCPQTGIAAHASGLQDLFDQHHGSLQRFVRRLGVSEQNVQDILQDTYLRFIRQREAGIEIQSPFTYLCTTAANLVRDQTRKQLRQKQDMHQSDSEVLLIDENASPDRSAHTSRQLAKLKKALLALPPKKQRILLLNQYEGLSCREIAAKTGTPFRSVQRYLNEALRFCQSTLRDYHDRSQ